MWVGPITLAALNSVGRSNHICSIVTHPQELVQALLSARFIMDPHSLKLEVEPLPRPRPAGGAKHRVCAEDVHFLWELLKHQLLGEDLREKVRRTGVDNGSASPWFSSQAACSASVERGNKLLTLTESTSTKSVFRLSLRTGRDPRTDSVERIEEQIITTCTATKMALSDK